MRLALCAVLVVLAGRPARADAPALPHVSYADDRITATLDQVDLGDVLAALAQATGAEVRGAPATPRKITAEFDRTPLTEALTRLLGGQNYTVRYGKGGKLTLIALAGGPEAPIPVPSTPPAAGIAAAPTTTTLPSKMRLPHRFAAHRPVPVPDRLAEILGTDKATFDQVFDLATSHDDGVVRVLAMQTALSALEREGGLRRSLFASLRKDDDGTLGAYLQTPGAIEMLEFMAAHSREPGLQKKANVLLEQVRPPIPDGAAGG